MYYEITKKLDVKKIYDVKNSTIGKATEFKEAALQSFKSHMKNLAAELRRDGALKAESRSPDFLTSHDF